MTTLAPPELRTLGERMRHARESARISMADAAAAMQILPTSLGNIERGRWASTVIRRIAARLYGVPLAWLLEAPRTVGAKRVQAPPTWQPEALREVVAPPLPPAPEPVAALPVAPCGTELDWLERRYLSRPRQPDEVLFLAHSIEDLIAWRHGLTELLRRWHDPSPIHPIAAVAAWLALERARRLKEET